MYVTFAYFQSILFVTTVFMSAAAVSTTEDPFGNEKISTISNCGPLCPESVKVNDIPSEWDNRKSGETESRPRRSPIPIPTPPTPPAPLQEFGMDAWEDRTTYDVVLLDSGRSNGREILLRELEDVSKTMPLPLPLPLRRLLKGIIHI